MELDSHLELTWRWHRMNRHLAFALAAAALAACVLFQNSPPSDASSTAERIAPEFPSLEASSWSGPPTSLASLRGKVVLLNVWTLGCVNCARTLPWVRSVWERNKDRGVAVIGVHSPEFEREKDREAVEKARSRNGLGYPSFLDNEHAYWRALDNHYWPTVYLLDKAGRIRATQVGEVHAGDEAAMRLEHR